MNLNIRYDEKDAAKAAFRAAGLPLTWNSAQKTWQTSATELPAALSRYAATAPSARAGKWLYLVSGYTGSPGYPYLVEFSAETADDLIAACERGFDADDEGMTDWFALSLISSDAKIGVGKMFPGKVHHWTHGDLVPALKKSAIPARRDLAARMEAADEVKSSAFVSRLLTA